MAYDTKELEEKALKAIKEKKIFFIEDVVRHLPCSSSTFYNHKLEKLESIKEALENNKVDVRDTLYNKWLKSDSPALQIALMKLVCSDEQRKKLATSYNENDNKENVTINWVEERMKE